MIWLAARQGLASHDPSRAGWGHLRVQPVRQVLGDEADLRTSQGVCLLVQGEQSPQRIRAQLWSS